jgi:hypothetical protein
MSHDRVDTALAALGDAVEIRPGSRKAQHHYLDGQRVPPEILENVPVADRPSVADAIPPAKDPPAEEAPPEDPPTEGAAPEDPPTEAPPAEEP